MMLAQKMLAMYSFFLSTAASFNLRKLLTLARTWGVDATPR